MKYDSEKKLLELNPDQLYPFNSPIELFLCRILYIIQSRLPYALKNNAWDYHVEFALFQIHPDSCRKPIVFWSERFDRA